VYIADFCKGKAVSQHAYGGAGGEVQLLLIHDHDTRWGEGPASRPGRALPLENLISITCLNFEFESRTTSLDILSFKVDFL
jgi:hypothetical protein